MNYRAYLAVPLLLAIHGPLQADSSPPSPPPQIIDSLPLKTPYHTEQEWIIGTICRNAFELLSVIADKKGEVVGADQITVKRIAGDSVSYQVTLHAAKVTVDATLHWPGSIWSSQAYVPFCQAALAQLKLSPVAAGKTAKGTPLATLLDFSEKSIEAENLRISQWLNEEPDNPAAQQQAALLLGTLAMKENSGMFWDPRDVLNHAMAHLAVARSLDSSGNLAIEGQLTECLVGLIDDTKKECADEIGAMGKIDGAPKELAAWLHAAAMRNTRDWRIVEKPEAASGFEQVEYFRALSEAVNPDQGIAWLRAKSVPVRLDFLRIVLEFTFSVDTGHMFATPSVASEIELMKTTFPARYSKGTFMSDLNESPDDVLIADSSQTLSLNVISDGMWAQYFQRHLCSAIEATGDFLQNKWGVPDQAAQFDQLIDQTFSRLNLFPFLQEANGIVRHRDVDPNALLKAFTEHPERAPDYIKRFIASPGVDLAPFQLAVGAWFSPAVVEGTTYCAGSRLETVGADLKKKPEAIHQLYTIAPLQFRMAELELTTRYSARPTTAQVQEIMGPLLDYYLPAVAWAATASDLTPEQKFALEKKSAELDPERYFDLAYDLLESKREGEAADAYQQWFDKGTDRVAVSNQMDWLVNYYYDHDQKDKALKIAEAGAKVYSSRGLTTMMDLDVRMGNLDEAEDYGKKIKERYEDSEALVAFYRSQIAKGNPRYQAKFDEEMAPIFPSGLKTVTLAALSGPPALGMKYGTTTPYMAEIGLSSDQVVVALDGYLVESKAQYSMILGFSKAPELDIIVWDGHSYREIKAKPPDRRFGVDILDYKH